MKLINCIEALDGLAVLGNEKLPISTSYKIAGHISKLREISAPFFDTRQKFIQEMNDQYGGDVPSDVSEKFKKDIESLLDQEVSLDLDKIDLSSCDISVNAKVLSMCMPFIKIDMDEHENS